ncbi:MAG: 30S ribosomal protein S18 [Microgenomates bacterium OLB22]|nr:MAG: 30S ribosomal protein S18 [Microgenomates bacterium OLB22]
MTKCYFKTHNIEPDFKDVETLKKFLTARMKIMDPARSGVCAKYQRKLAKQIKYARYMALIPYTAYQGMRIEKNVADMDRSEETEYVNPSQG